MSQEEMNTAIWHVEVEVTQRATYYVVAANRAQAEAIAEDEFTGRPPDDGFPEAWGQQLAPEAVLKLPGDTPIMTDKGEVTMADLSEVLEGLEEAKGEAIRRELQHTLPLEIP